MKPNQLETVEGQIGYTFADKKLLEDALVHASCFREKGTSPFERFEFLGDRVLALAIADLLYRHFPEDDEGKLSLRLIALVRGEMLAKIAASLGLARAIKTFGLKDKTTNVLADACEAIIAAIYLDGGFAAAYAWIQAHWQAYIEMPLGALKDAKTSLQEWLQGRGLQPTQYHLVERKGTDHQPHFTVIAKSEEMAAEAEGGGLTKKEAEQAAAAKLLQILSKRD